MASDVSRSRADRALRRHGVVLTRGELEPVAALLDAPSPGTSPLRVIFAAVSRAVPTEVNAVATAKAVARELFPDDRRRLGRDPLPTMGEVFVLRERLETVSRDRRFVWVDRAGSEAAVMAPGTVIRPFRGYDSPAWREAEEVLEAARREVAPSAPTRIGCIFVFPGTAFRTAGDWSRDWETGGRKNVYQVEVTGRVFYADMESSTEVVECLNPKAGKGGGTDRGRRDAMAFARQYWEGVSSSGQRQTRMVEGLVDGRVEVVRRIDPSKLGRPPAKF